MEGHSTTLNFPQVKTFINPKQKLLIYSEYLAIFYSHLNGWGFGGECRVNLTPQ